MKFKWHVSILRWGLSNFFSEHVIYYSIFSGWFCLSVSDGEWEPCSLKWQALINCSFVKWTFAVSAGCFLSFLWLYYHMYHATSQNGGKQHQSTLHVNHFVTSWSQDLDSLWKLTVYSDQLRFEVVSVWLCFLICLFCFQLELETTMRQECEAKLTLTSTNYESKITSLEKEITQVTSSVPLPSWFCVCQFSCMGLFLCRENSNQT